MTDISRAERRLIAALDRLDHAVERAARRIALPTAPVAPVAPAAGQVARPSDPEPQTHSAPPVTEAPVSAEVAALHGRQAATLEAMQMRLAEAHERLAATGEQAARLAAANDDLARANRALIDAASETWPADGPDATRAALEAEVEALRAARAAEIAQMAEILDALDRMLGITTTPRSHSTEMRRDAGRAGRPHAAPEPADAATPQDPAARAESAAEAPAEPEPRELTVIRDADPLPEEAEDYAPAEPLQDDPLPEDDLPEDDLADSHPADVDLTDTALAETGRSGRATSGTKRDPDPTVAAQLFGGVYDDDPGALDADPDDEERR